MIIAVTGASGSIGRELVPFLEDLGQTVLQISSSQPSNEKLRFTYVQLQNKEISINIDLFIHLASLNADVNSTNFQDEVSLTETVLCSLPSLKCNQLIFFSTAKVYGENNFRKKVYSESSPLNPECFYGKAKKKCEELILENKSINSLIFRLPPLINYSSSNLGKLLTLSRKNILLPTFDAGYLNQRSFISMANINLTIKHLIKNIEFIENQKTYNLSDRGIISLNELLSIKKARSFLVLPTPLYKVLIKIPVIRSFLLKLFGNFVLDNSKLTTEMNVTLITTKDALSAMNQ